MKKEQEYIMDAVFTEKSYNALMSGAAVDNNGLRSPKGNYWPEQPSYRPRNSRQEALKDAGNELRIYARDYVVSNIVLPACKRFIDQKVYPFLAEKFDDLTNRKKKAVAAPSENKPAKKETVQPKADNIIYFDQYRKMA